MLRFAKLCKCVGSRTAYDVLAAVVQHASTIAPEARQDTLGYAYEEYADQEYRNRYNFRTGFYFKIKKWDL